MYYITNSMEEQVSRIARDKKVTPREAERIMRELELMNYGSIKKIISALLIRGWQ